jgi:hypothetical protein
MDDNIVLRLELQVRQIELADGVECRRYGAFALGASARRTEFALHLTKYAEHTSAVEALSFTVFAEAHGGKFTEKPGRPVVFAKNVASATSHTRHIANHSDGNPC